MTRHGHMRINPTPPVKLKTPQRLPHPVWVLAQLQSRRRLAPPPALRRLRLAAHSRPTSHGHRAGLLKSLRLPTAPHHSLRPTRRRHSTLARQPHRQLPRRPVSARPGRQGVERALQRLRASARNVPLVTPVRLLFRSTLNSFWFGR